jgi:hypothetical protein
MTHYLNQGFAPTNPTSSLLHNPSSSLNPNPPFGTNIGLSLTQYNQSPYGYANIHGQGLQSLNYNPFTNPQHLRFPFQRDENLDFENEGIFANQNLFKLSQENPHRHITINHLNQPVKDSLFEIELKTLNLSNMKDYVKDQVRDLDSQIVSLRNQSVECMKTVKNAESKQERIKFQIDELVRECHENNNEYEEIYKEWTMLKGQHSISINLPSAFFVRLEQNLQQRLKKYTETIDQLQELITLQLEVKIIWSLKIVLGEGG